MQETNLQTRSSLELAYLGDAVFELMVREHFFLNGSSRTSDLHSSSVAIVCAKAQAAAARAIEPMLTEEEHAVFQRGRNAKPKTIPKAADHADYMRATALESLFGWLYLNHRKERLNELFAKAIDACGAGL
jgi:ribonuclease-3 family protein